MFKITRGDEKKGATTRYKFRSFPFFLHVHPFYAISRNMKIFFRACLRLVALFEWENKMWVKWKTLLWVLCGLRLSAKVRIAEIHIIISILSAFKFLPKKRLKFCDMTAHMLLFTWVIAYFYQYTWLRENFFLLLFIRPGAAETAN